MSHVWKPSEDVDHVVAAKGAPEAIAEMCHLDQPLLNEIRNAADQMAAQGMRVLGVAKASYQGPPWPESQHEFAFEFLGLVGLADPLRPTVPDAVRECRSAGIRVVMITGDYPATARAIAEQAGFDVDGGTVTGDGLARMSDSELRERVRTIAIFARIMPEQKLRIVSAFKANGEIVATTGDGVNDAPSLKAAHIGIAMGSRGTDVAREAAALVLLDDDFGSIVSAVRLGRRIYDNLRKAMGYLLAVHVPIAGLALLPLLFGWPLIFSPVHIAFLELIIDPVSSVVFEAEVAEGDLMRRLPRDSQRPLFSPALITWSLVHYDELDRVEEILKDSGAEEIRSSAESAVSDESPEREAVGEIRPYTRDSATLNADRNNTSADDYGVKAGREYERAVRDFEATGQAGAKAQEAKAAVEGPEREELRRAEQIGKGRAKTKTAHDNE